MYLLASGRRQLVVLLVRVRGPPQLVAGRPDSLFGPPDLSSPSPTSSVRYRPPPWPYSRLAQTATGRQWQARRWLGRYSPVLTIQPRLAASRSTAPRARGSGGASMTDQTSSAVIHS